MADSRGLDPASRYLTAAAAAALAEGGIAIRGSLRDRTGLIVGMTEPSPASAAAFEQSIRQRGLALLSAAAFARVVLNAPIGCCSKLLTLRGPCLTLTTGSGSGLTAILSAIALLTVRDDADLLVAGGVDEMAAEADARPRDAAACDGAGCLVVGSRPIDHETPAVRIAGWGLAGRGQLAHAIRSALRMARVTPAQVRLVFVADHSDSAAIQTQGWSGAAVTDVSRLLGHSSAATSAWSAIAAVLAARAGLAPYILVVGGSGSPAGGALLLESPQRGVDGY
jgi:3-oxoacyl-(acyl-carrier-protein) synthase